MRERNKPNKTKKKKVEEYRYEQKEIIRKEIELFPLCDLRILPLSYSYEVDRKRIIEYIEVSISLILCTVPKTRYIL